MDSPPSDISSLEPKFCWHPDCKKPLVQRENERISTFKRRKHCNDDCARSNPLRRKRQAEGYARLREEEQRTCSFCSGKFFRNKSESRAIFQLRETCGRKCADAKRKKANRELIAKETKICKGCGGTFTRNVDRKHIESPSSFKKRENCGNSCRVLGNKTTHPWDKKGSGGGKSLKMSTLPPVSECPIDIPPPTKPKLVEVWRPASLGGPFMREVS